MPDIPVPWGALVRLIPGLFSRCIVTRSALYVGRTGGPTVDCGIVHADPRGSGSHGMPRHDAECQKRGRDNRMQPLVRFTTFLCAALGAVCLLLSLLAPPAAHAQDKGAWPARTVRLVVPYAPGGLPDTVARIVGQRL